MPLCVSWDATCDCTGCSYCDNVPELAGGCNDDAATILADTKAEVITELRSEGWSVTRRGKHDHVRCPGCKGKKMRGA